MKVDFALLLVTNRSCFVRDAFLGFKPTGSVKIGALGDQSYNYDPASANKNARTIQGFSTGAKAKMYDCDKCPYTTYKKYYDYYQAYDYGDKWVQAAFGKTQANFAKGLSLIHI